ncbi:DUF732 domain-containing protein [Aliterella atlantica]|uniref:Uncharacterized protein n=1 Tax=Aliterella atlantica CENA595 TaxID=1618023 RepID=A0A0D8ZTT8_9CYAN|nr:DUF732 domain-containing protein [Aliterella atlantica]KJH72155.1 hypothetical protein UH38_08805 [Aliterella atlantica CENA595]
MASNNIQKVFCHCVVAFYTVVGSGLTTQVAFSLPVDKTLEYPVSSLDADNPICYIQQSNGSTLDLSQLCSQDGTKTRLSLIDRQFLDTYNNSLNAYQKQRNLVTPDAARLDPLSPIQVAQDICSALNNQVPIEQIQEQQYQNISATEDRRNQNIALIESDMLNSLAIKFYCPQFTQRAVNRAN